MILLSGCHSGGATSVTIQLLPASSVSIDEGQSTTFTATVANDINNQGVTWSLVQTTSTVCSGAGCGALKNATNSSVTYVAPTNLTVAETVTLTARALANTSTTTTATISVSLPPQFNTTATPNNNNTSTVPFTLPNASNGVAYNETLTVTGGISPLIFSLAPGSSLPAGLTLNSSGTIVGKPSVPAVGQPVLPASFTAVVTDNGAPPIAVSQVFTFSVNPPPLLSITTTSLPSGLANSSYTALIASSGGVSPLTWSVVSGSLPTGLALSTTSGQIAGNVSSSIPNGMAFPFTVQVKDSTLPSPGQIVQKPFSITVQQPTPPAISTTSLPTGTTAAAYNTSLQGSGGIPPYTWSIVSGQLPSGLTLSPTGTISGLPVLENSSPDVFTVQLQDSETTPPVVTQQLSIVVQANTGSNNALISGSYSFLFNGFDVAGPVAIAGTITTDGNGNITSGLQDSNRVCTVAASSSCPSNGSIQVVNGSPLTGTYSLGPDGRGTMQLVATNPASGVTLTTDYRIVLDSTGRIRFIQNNDITTVGVGTDTVGTQGEGIMKPVVGVLTAGGVNGNYAFLFTGEDQSGKRAALAGAINANSSTDTIVPAAGGVSSDFNDAGSFSNQNVSGTFSVGSGNRGAMQIQLPIPTKSTSVMQFAFYYVSSTDLYFVETDMTINAQTPVFYRLSGEMIQQSTGYAFVNTSLMGSSVITGSGLNGSNASVLAGLFTGTATSQGVGTVSLIYDENNGGAITTPSPSFSGGYSVANNGRATFSSLGSRVTVAYLTGPGQGFVLGSDAAVTSGLLEEQAAGTYSLASVEGGYTLGTSLPVDTATPNVVGQVTANGSGGINGTIDEIDPPTTTPPAPEGTANLGESLSATITFVGTNGRGTAVSNAPKGFPANMILYLVSPSDFRAISVDSTSNGHPDVFFFDH